MNATLEALVKSELDRIGYDLVRIRQGGRGKQSGAEVDMPPYLQVYRLRDGRAVRIEVYRDQTEALKAARLAG